MRLDLKPIHPTEGLFLFIMVVALAFYLLNVTKVYSHGPLATFLVALCISIIPMFAVAFLMERSWLWPPSEQYAAFFYGDLIGLPAVAVAFSLLRANHDGGTLADRPWWKLMWVILGLAAGLAFHAMDFGNYSTEQFHSPTKLLHDLFVYPIFVYFLGSQIPLLFQKHWAVALAVTGFTFWAACGAYDAFHEKPKAHIKYSWADLRPVSQVSSR